MIIGVYIDARTATTSSIYTSTSHCCSSVLYCSARRRATTKNESLGRRCSVRCAHQHHHDINIRIQEEEEGKQTHENTAAHQPAKLPHEPRTSRGLLHFSHLERVLYCSSEYI